MKKQLLALTATSAMALSASAQVYINELLINAPGGDGGKEFFELRGAPNTPLSGYYLLSIEGEGTTGKGDINQYVDLTSYSLGANGYLVGRQFATPYGAVDPAATLIQPTAGPGWVSPFYFTDGTGSDMENSATSILLVNIGSGAAPTLATDLDTEGDGVLDLPSGWTVVDSVGLFDSVGATATDRGYGVVNIRLGTVGSNVSGELIQVPGTGTTLYAGRIGDSTGSTATDWFGGVLDTNFVFTANVSDPRAEGKSLADLGYGSINAVPEPTSLALLGLGLAGLILRRKF